MYLVKKAKKYSHSFANRTPTWRELELNPLKFNLVNLLDLDDRKAWIKLSVRLSSLLSFPLRTDNLEKDRPLDIKLVRKS